MNYERNKKYFEQNLPVWPTVASFAAIAVGAFIFIFLGFSRFGGGYIFIPLGLLLMLAGLIGFVAISTVKIRDSEIDELLPALEERFAADFNSRFTVTDAAKIRYQNTYGAAASHSAKFEPVFVNTFCFDNPEAMHKNGSDSKSRSSYYSVAGFGLKPGSVCVGARVISLVSAASPKEDVFKELKYTELSDCLLAEAGESGYTGKTKYRHLRFIGKDGQTVAEFPILADASADEYADEIRVRIGRAHEKE
ncbi:MAG: hypothetical protein MJ137_03715 [Clostridia bacterium]|nr:hypothetical protein [Clostridia bacterium]